MTKNKYDLKCVNFIFVNENYNAFYWLGNLFSFYYLFVILGC